jgi:hypothetical protein
MNGGMPLYRDSNHLTASQARAMAYLFDPLFAAPLEGTRTSRVNPRCEPGQVPATVRQVKSLDKGLKRLSDSPLRGLPQLGKSSTIITQFHW